jgi:alpha/beta superfamily hydrolase
MTRDLQEPSAIWLTGGSWPILGLVHEPAGPARGGVVLCPPLFGEQLAARPLYRAVGRALAEQGLLALRFDYQGTGDSGGPPTGGDRLEAWLDGVADAAATTRERSRGPVALVGVRSGALIAAVAAERRTDADAVVLWDPWQSGRSFLRREHALHALQFGTPSARLPMEVWGQVLDAATADAVASLRLPPRLRARRALVVVRPGTKPAPLALEPRRGGSAVRTTADVLELAAGEHEALFEADVLRRRIPAGAVANVAHWLSDAIAQLGTTPPGPGRAAARRAGAAPSWVPASTLAAVPPGAPGEPTVYERSVRIGHHGLFGIETLPSPNVPPEAPVVLFFPTGMDSHIGPHRLWVDLARRWASLGARCVRVDLSGLGESAPRPGRPELVVRAPEAFDDVADAVRWAGGPARAVLVGLCSSAYQVLESAIELEPLGVLSVNPLLRFTPPELAAGGEMSGRRRLCQPRRVWQGAARRALPEPVGQAIADLRRLLVRWRRKLTKRGAGTARLALAGVDVRVVCREDEAEQLAAFGLVDRPEEGVRVVVVPELEHSLAHAVQRQEVADRLTTMLRSMTGPSLEAVRWREAARPATVLALAAGPGPAHEDRAREQEA